MAHRFKMIMAKHHNFSRHSPLADSVVRSPNLFFINLTFRPSAYIRFTISTHLNLHRHLRAPTGSTYVFVYANSMIQHVCNQMNRSSKHFIIHDQRVLPLTAEGRRNSNISYQTHSNICAFCVSIRYRSRKYMLRLFHFSH